MARGSAVMVSARDGSEAAAAAAALRQEWPQARLGWATCDVRDPTQLEALWVNTELRLGTPSVWINNAGLALGGRTLLQTSGEELRLMAEVNLLGTMNGCRVAAANMGALGGAIYNIHGAGSDGRPVPGMIGYGTTKRAVQFFTQALAQELDPALITVCGLSPGLVMTEGFFREHARVPRSERVAREAAVNLLGDHVETVCPLGSGHHRDQSRKRPGVLSGSRPTSSMWRPPVRPAAQRPRPLSRRQRRTAGRRSWLSRRCRPISWSATPMS